MPKKRCPYLFSTGMILLAMLVPGCGKPQQPAEKAERVVEQFLDAWSRGEPLDKFADAGLPIHGTDPDWKAGHRLLSFLCDDAQPSQETPGHVRCRVALSLQDQKGKRVDKKVDYDVQLGEKSAITRVSP